MPRTRRLHLLSLLAFAAAAALLTLADRGPLAPDELSEGCVDWWCSRDNSLPVGLALLLVGLGLLGVLRGLLARIPDEGPAAQVAPGVGSAAPGAGSAAPGAGSAAPGTGSTAPGVPLAAAWPHAPRRVEPPRRRRR